MIRDESVVSLVFPGECMSRNNRLFVRGTTELIITTNKCSKAKHPEFSFCIDPNTVVQDDLVWFRSTLEADVLRGSRYQAGETLQIGWMLNSLIQREDGTLGVLEPDFKSIPIVWVDSVTTTLQHLRLQKAVVESVGFGGQIQYPSILQSGLIGVDLTPQPGRLICDRSEEEGTDSGWFVGNAETACDYNNPTNLIRLSLYQMSLLVPNVVMFFALPCQCRVVFVDRSVEIYYCERRLDILPNSFLHQLLL